MKRRKQRELVFLLLFESIFTGYTLEEIKEHKVFLNILDEGDFNEFVVSYFKGIIENVSQIDELIDKNSLKWGKDRLSKVAITLLRIAVYEMLYRDDIPTSVAINEAIELSKKYGTDKESNFINGILGGISRGMETLDV